MVSDRWAARVAHGLDAQMQHLGGPSLSLGWSFRSLSLLGNGERPPAANLAGSIHLTCQAISWVRRSTGGLFCLCSGQWSFAMERIPGNPLLSLWLPLRTISVLHDNASNIATNCGRATPSRKCYSERTVFTNAGAVSRWYSAAFRKDHREYMPQRSRPHVRASVWTFPENIGQV